MDKSNLVIFDVECYRNYFLIMFRKVSNGETLSFEKWGDSQLDISSILGLMNKYTVLSFNGINYDMPVIEAAVAGFSCEALYGVSKMIIEENLRPWQIRKQIGVTALFIDHIDIYEVTPLRATLKIYGGRLNCPKMQDLPIDPHLPIRDDQREPMKTYCANDLELTQIVMEDIEKGIDLRCMMSETYKVDLRSKSDAQIAEAVIKHELVSNYGIQAKRPSISGGTEYIYIPPDNLAFTSKVMKEVFAEFQEHPFTVNKSGHIDLPEVLKNKKIEIGETTYKIGVGGLHSCEKSARHVAEDGMILRDYDVTSYYPMIILNNKLYPKHLGPGFLKIYERLVNQRIKAKREKDMSTADSLRITINGSFGKLASKWSCLYSPDLMMQVTVTGQLSLLMLIESFEENGIQVVSANTDGIVIKTPEENEELAAELVSDWEFETDYNMENNDYVSLSSRDINNYVAVYKDGGVKGKGDFAKQGLFKNPSRPICSTAVKAFLDKATPIEETVKGCKDIAQFIIVRTVNGGAVKDDELLGKSIRWYYGKYELDAIFYNTNGNKVPKSDGGVPVMELPEEIPEDIDFDWYINEANKMLRLVGYK